MAIKDVLENAKAAIQEKLEIVKVSMLAHEDAHRSYVEAEKIAHKLQAEIAEVDAVLSGKAPSVTGERKPISEETRAKMRASQAAWRARKAAEANGEGTVSYDHTPPPGSDFASE